MTIVLIVKRDNDSGGGADDSEGGDCNGEVGDDDH